jgi:hypothetical protein
VIFLGPVSQQHLVRLYRHAEALVFASLYEGFGLPPLEAMAVATPVIALPVSAMPEVCGDGALFAGGLSPESLCRAMECVAADRDLRNNLRERGYLRVRAYSWQKTARATFEAYRSAILHPSDRSLCLRRSLREAIIDWSMKNSRRSAHATDPPGVRESWHGLKTALHARLRREITRFRPLAPGRIR